MKKSCLVLLVLLTLGACATPPAPPSCDGDNKRPVNPQQKRAAEALGAISPASYKSCA